MTPRKSKPRARAEKAGDCAARLSEWERAETMRDVRRLLCVALRRMTARERRVLYCRYLVGLTLEETSRAIGCGTRERVRQIEAMALRRLRHPKRREVRVAGDLLGLCTPAMLLGRHP